MEIDITHQLTTLGHPKRLAIFRLLVRRFPDQVPAGELAEALDLKGSTLSAYLSALMQARLVTQERHGTSLRYSVDMQEVRHTFDYLFLDCCRGRAELCGLSAKPCTEPAGPGTRPRYKVLFLCTGNSARSIFAEAILRKEAGDRFEVFSAGTKPKSELNPFALEVLKQNGHDISRLRAKSVTELKGPDAPTFDFVFTVCDRAANEDCPAWVGQPVNAHWGVPDPVKPDGNTAEKNLAFHQTYGALRNRILAFAALPIASLDKISLQRALDDLARTETGENT